MAAKEVARSPPQSEAEARSAPVTSRMRSGMTGKMMPIPMESIITVTRMKTRARRFCMGFAAGAEKGRPGGARLARSGGEGKGGLSARDPGKQPRQQVRHGEEGRMAAWHAVDAIGREGCRHGLLVLGRDGVVVL